MARHTETLIDQATAAQGAFVLRLALGSMWLSHGLLKLVVFSPAGFAGFLGSVGLPAALAWPIILAEIIGGLMILTGFFGRHASLVLIPLMVGATMVHVPNGWVFSVPNGGWEYPAFLIAASLAHGLIGEGAYALRRAPLWPFRAAETAQVRTA
jgi:putative oxidoreductase